MISISPDPRESVILESLNKTGVRNIPTLVCGGAVCDQETTSHTYIEKDWNDGAHLTMIYIRVGRHLRRFKAWKRLTRVIYDTFLGVTKARSQYVDTFTVMSAVGTS
ncbi:hypothetical protein EDD18DRAFT_1145638 [Armillaria luteobubalina]|uniref:Fungal-type protein kinase domain-containing protein n=1 Tax=Armillaria luteobubalina TaxID=153913 RepID=A0AA39QES1_9AGAR|nr:hypothetical protein EDD18DRAFT_1145638 [Armillaria luteobubalina]